MTLDLYVLGCVIVTAAGFVSFVALYARLAAWWRDELGQALMGALAMVALFLVLAVVWRVAPGWAGWPYLRVACWTAIAVAAVRLPWAFLKTRAADRRTRNPNDGSSPMKFVRKYRKLWWAIGATVLAMLVALSDPTSSNGILIEDGISRAELLLLAPMAAGALVVHLAPEVPGARQVKSACYLLIGLVAVLPTAAILDGITWTEGMMLGAYVLGYLGVRNATNVGDLLDRYSARDPRPPFARPPRVR